MISRSTYYHNHHSLSVLEAGDPSDPVAFFLHGIPASAELWRGVLDQVSAAGYYCVAPDCPGYGRTRMHKTKDYSLKSQARFFLDWIVEQEFQDIWLIGHDLGGGVAQIMLVERPDLFQRASLSNCAVADSWPVPIIKLMRFVARMGLFPWASRIGLMTTPISIQKLKEAVYDRSVLDKETVSRIFIDSKFHDQQGRVEFGRLLKSLDNQDTMDVLEDLRKVTIPVQLIWGLNDPNQPWSTSGRLLEETLPNTTYTPLERAGHFLMLDANKRYVDSLLE